MRKLIVLVFSILLAASALDAQTPTGRLLGIVSGPDGVLPNATITVKFNQTGKEQTVVTDGGGAFSLAQLEPGNYTVTITSGGFKTFVANDVKIDIGREYNLTPVLEIGKVEESVTVTAGADVVTSTSAQVTNTVSPQQILSLPLITRDPLNLTTLQAGTASNPFQGTSINGMRTSMTNITRDGISINDAFIRTNATDFAPGRPSVDDTGEFTISTSNQEADLGSGGAQIILVTPRGQKDFHGALFAYNRNSHFAANNFFSNRAGKFGDGAATDGCLALGKCTAGEDRTPRPFRNRNQYGGKFSGPFPTFHFGEGGPTFDRHKGFFFLAYEGIRDPLAAVANRTILTPSARTGAFSFRRAAAGNPTTVCPDGAAGSLCTVSNILTFAQTQLGVGANIPGTIDPVIQSRVLGVMPTAGNTTGGDSLNTTGYTFNRRQDTTRQTYTTRLDFDATDKDSVSGVFSWNKENVLRPDVDITGFDVVPTVTQYSKNKTFTLSYRRIFSNSIVNEVRYGIFTSEVPFQRVSPIPSYFLGAQGTTSGTLAGIIDNPDNIFLNQGRNNKTFTFADNLNYIVGKHSFKFGGQFQKYKINSYNDVLIVPNYTLGVSTIYGTALQTTNPGFSNCPVATPNCGSSLIDTASLATANGLLALLGGIVSNASQGFNTVDPTSGYQTATNLSPFRNSNHALYASDRWSIARGLTLSLGARYELYPALKLANGLSLEPVISNPDDPAASLLAGNGTYDIIGTNAGKKYLYYKTDYNNLAPSVGVAYTPNFSSGVARFLLGSEGKTVLRGGYSQVYANDSIITSLNSTLSANIGLGRASNSLLTAGNATINGRLGAGLPTITPPAFITPPRSFLQNSTSAQSFFGTTNVVDPKLQIPKVEQYSFGYQRELFGNMALEVRYVGSRSKNLARGVDLNQIDIINNGFLADFQRAQSNQALTGTPFCTPGVGGCQALTIFQNGAAGGVSSPGKLAVGATGSTVTLAGFRTALQNGNVADFAQSFISGTTAGILGQNLNNYPTLASPNNIPFVKFYPNPNTGQIELFTNAGSYNYNSLQIEIRRRFTQGLYFQANYTFSKNLTNTVGTSQQLFEPFLQNQDQALDNQRADFDQTHTFNFNGVYQLPFGKGKMFLNQGGIVNKIFGGFELSGLLQTGSGAPISFLDPRGTLNRVGRSGRQTANSTLTNDQIRALSGFFEANGRIYFIDPSVIDSSGRGAAPYVAPGGTAPTFTNYAFTSVAPGQTGNVARTLINGPRQFNVNAALLKNINFTETLRVQLRMEAFNLFNNVNFFNNTQLANVTSATFGQITSAGAARQVQFAARFEF